MIGLIVLFFGLASLLLSTISLGYGVRDLTALAGTIVGLLSLVAGYHLYRRWSRKFITKREVAKLFGVSEHTVEYWLRDGKLPKPKRKLGFRRWNYYEVTALRKFKKNRSRLE
jgi:excisionase family DNA binding protein